jgi:hypothetical protein
MSKNTKGKKNLIPDMNQNQVNKLYLRNIETLKLSYGRE